MNSYLFK